MKQKTKRGLILVVGMIILLAAGCRPGGGTPVYDVVVVGGGPAGIGAALAAAETGARTTLIERDSRIGGTTVQAEVCDMGLFYAWRRPIITGPGWEMVQRAVAEAGGTLPDFSKQEPDQWMESCVHVDPVVYARVAEETLRQAGVDLFLETEVLSVEKTKKGWRVGPVEGRQVVDATGSATVAALAGAERVREPDDTRQPGSFFFWIDSQGLEFDADEVNRNYKEAIEKGEMLPTDVHVGMSWFIRKGGGSGCYVPLADNSTPEARAATNRRGIEARDRVLAFIHRQKGLENVRLTPRMRCPGRTGWWMSTTPAPAAPASFSISRNAWGPFLWALCFPRASAICWSPAAPFPVTTAPIPPSASRLLAWAWGKPRASRRPSPPGGAAIPGTFPST